MQDQAGKLKLISTPQPRPSEALGFRVYIGFRVFKGFRV